MRFCHIFCLIIFNISGKREIANWIFELSVITDLMSKISRSLFHKIWECILVWASVPQLNSMWLL